MATITKYRMTGGISLPNSKLLLKDDIVYISASYYVMDGIYAYARDVYDENRVYLAKIRDDYFWNELNYYLKTE